MNEMPSQQDRVADFFADSTMSFKPPLRNVMGTHSMGLNRPEGAAHILRRLHALVVFRDGVNFTFA